MNRELSSVICDDLEGRDGGGREGICVYLWLIHTVVQQTLTQVVKELYPNKMITHKIVHENCAMWWSQRCSECIWELREAAAIRNQAPRQLETRYHRAQLVLHTACCSVGAYA